MTATRGYPKDAPSGDWRDDEEGEQSVPRLTAEDVALLRQAAPSVSPWVVVGLQSVAGLLVIGIAWVFWDGIAALSAAYGAIAVIIPAALFARGIMSKFSSLNAATASFGFFLWEAIKIGASLTLIALAPRLIADLNWLAMLAGLFFTLKMYWIALLLRPRPNLNLKA